MAKVIKLGAKGKEYKTQKCPQCSRIVPLENVLPDGLKCPRCGKFPWGKVKSEHERIFRTFLVNPDLRRTKEG